MQGLIECATYNGADIVLNSVVGMIGLMPTLEAIKAKKTIALANKETLVAGGHLVTNLAKENGVYLVNLAAAVCNQNGVLPEGCSTDGVHANVATSRSLMQYIKTHTHR